MMTLPLRRQKEAASADTPFCLKPINSASCDPLKLATISTMMLLALEFSAGNMSRPSHPRASNRRRSLGRALRIVIIRATCALLPEPMDPRVHCEMVSAPNAPQ